MATATQPRRSPGQQLEELLGAAACARIVKHMAMLDVIYPEDSIELQVRLRRPSPQRWSRVRIQAVLPCEDLVDGQVQTAPTRRRRRRER